MELNSHEKGCETEALEEEMRSALGAEDLLPEDRQDQTRVVTELSEAVTEYRHHLNPDVAAQRKELRMLADKLEAALDHLENLSPQSIHSFCDQTGQPRGKTSGDLREALVASRMAAKCAEMLPDKASGIARKILAVRVAQVMRDNMGIRTSATRDNTDLHVGKKDGAAYARLLRKVLSIAGEEPPADLYPLVSVARTILSNPRGDSLT